MIGGANTRDVVNHTFGEALEATQSSYPKPFDASSFNTPGCQGMTIEGKIVELRHHTLIDSNKTYHRYLAIVIQVPFQVVFLSSFCCSLSFFFCFSGFSLFFLFTFSLFLSSSFFF
jgi:hypothetical protein